MLNQLHLLTLMLKAMIKISNLKCSDLVRILKYKNIFAKIYILSWSEEVSFIKDVKNIVAQTSVTSDSNEEENVGELYEKELRITNQSESRVEKVIKKKDKLYFK